MKNTDNTQTKHNPEKSNNAITPQNKTSLVKSSQTTIGHETRWAYSTTWLWDAGTKSTRLVLCYMGLKHSTKSTHKIVDSQSEMWILQSNSVSHVATLCTRQ